MPRRGLPGPHQIGRRRPLRGRCRADGFWYGYGPEQEDAVSGWLFPKKLMVEQRGGLVSRLMKDGSLDLPKEW